MNYLGFVISWILYCLFLFDIFCGFCHIRYFYKKIFRRRLDWTWQFGLTWYHKCPVCGCVIHGESKESGWVQDYICPVGHYELH